MSVTTKRKPAVKAAPVKSTRQQRAAKPAPKTFSEDEVKGLIKQIVNRYDAAGTGRRLRGWNPPTSGPNRAIVGTQKLIDRSRDSVRNDWVSSSGVQHWTTNLIGTGIVPRIKVLTLKAKKARYNKLWCDWCEQADANSVSDFYALQTLATREWLESGEVFVRLRPRQLYDSLDLPVPMQIQLIESDYVPRLDTDYWSGLPTGNRIRSGIEINRIGQRVAYWVYKEHPSDTEAIASINMQDLIRVPASLMLHIYEPKRTNQMRGVPDFSPVIARLRNVLDFDDATLERMKIGNLLVGFLTRQPLAANADGVDPMTGLPVEMDRSGPIAGMEPGTIQELDPGEEITFSNPPEQGTTYSDYMRTQHLGNAAGQNLPYEIMSGDIANVSDRTLRVIINEFRRFAEQRQRQVIIPKFCKPIRKYWVDQGVLAGVIDLVDADELKDCVWSPQGWAYIHPTQDAEGKQIEVDNGFRSRSSVIAEDGNDPEDVDDERKVDFERETALGLPHITPTPDQKQGGNPAQQGGANEPDDPPSKTKKALADLNASIGRLETFMSGVQAHITAAGAQKQEAPSFTAHVHLPEGLVVNQVPVPKVEVTNNIEPTAVTIDNKVDVSPTPVTVQNNIEPTTVTVTAPAVTVTNNVDPTPITVVNNVDVELPTRQTTSKITRDDRDNIIGVVQTEKTVN